MRLHKGLLEILVLALLWGPSYLFIKIAVSDIAPITMSVLRIGIGGLLLFFVLKFRKLNLWDYRKVWMHLFVIGLFANALPFIFFNYSMMYIPTSLSALINGVTPVLTIILANIFLKDEQLTWGRGVGVVISLFGFCVLFVPTVLGSLQGSDMGLDITGILLSFIASCSYAIGMIYVRKNLPSMPPLVAPVIQLFSTLTYLIPLAFIVESPIEMIQTASLPAWLAVFAMAILGTSLAFMMYYRIIERQGATALSTVTYLLPVFGTVLGVVFLQETVGIQFCIAATFILSGVLIVNGVVSLPFLKRNKIAA